MMKRRLVLTAASALALGLGLAGAGHAQDSYPDRPITFIVPSAAGGGLDIATRKAAELMKGPLGQNIIVENRTGADTITGSRHVLDTKPDGYTVLAHATTMSLLPYAYKDVGFSPLEDFVPIGPMLYQSNVFSVGKDSPFKTITELVDHARAHPGELTYGTGGQASPQSYTVAMMKMATGVDLTPIQYKGSGATFPDVIAGRVSLVSSGYSGQAGFYPDGSLRPLAVSGAKRIPALPDVPTLKEQGIDVESEPWLGLFVAKGTPESVVQKLSDALKAALDDPAHREQIMAEGGDPRFQTPAEFAQQLTREAEEFGALAKATGMVPQ